LQASGHLCPHLRCCQQIKMGGGAEQQDKWAVALAGFGLPCSHLRHCQQSKLGSGAGYIGAAHAAREGCLEQQDKVAVALIPCRLRAALLTRA
jgi:hypothetical protein